MSIKSILRGIILATIGLSLALPNYAVASVYRVPEACQPYIDEIEKYNWETSTVIKIMYLESRCNPKATNLRDSHGRCKGSFGLLQLACVHKGGNKYDPKENIRIAYRVYQEAGNSFRPWSTYKKIK